MPRLATLPPDGGGGCPRRLVGRLPPGRLSGVPRLHLGMPGRNMPRVMVGYHDRLLGLPLLGIEVSVVIIIFIFILIV